jgi:hypothetical protein
MTAAIKANPVRNLFVGINNWFYTNIGNFRT